MKRPIIAITVNYDKAHMTYSVSQLYADSIIRAGGIPVYVTSYIDESSAEELINSVDGLLLSGGGDIAPFYYGEDKKEYCGEPSQERDFTENLLFNYACKKDIPILGICRGIQAMNVFAGGTLIQDIEAQMEGITRAEHMQPPPYCNYSHPVKVIKGTPLYDIFGGKDTIFTNSMHHQSVKDPAPGYLVAATSSEGRVIEAIINPDKKFAIGIQWHPEHLWGVSSETAQLFNAFVKAC